MGKLKDAILPQPASFAKKKRYELQVKNRTYQPATLPCAQPINHTPFSLIHCIQTILGTGSFGKVIKALWSPPDGSEPRLVALKVIPKKRVKGNEQAVWSEMSVLDGLDHPNIVESFSPRSNIPPFPPGGQYER